LEETSTQNFQADLALPRPAGMTFARRLLWAARFAALLAAVAVALHASQIMDKSNLSRFWEALVWFGIALLLALAFAWDVSVSPPAQWRSRLISFWSRHRIEIILFLFILGFGVFMRLFMYGVIPPSNSLTFEEGLQGGVAFRALHGEPEIAFAITRYASSLGFLLLGYNALGLRIIFIVGGVLSIPVLYLLLRELVSASIALFGTLLFAAAYWPSLLDRHAFEIGTVLTLLMAFLLVKGIKTHSSLAFFGLGILCSLISYEYENFKPAPLYAVGFLALLGLWQLLPAIRRGLRPARDAILATSRKAWRPALAFTLAAGITAGPMLVGAHLGKDVYLSSLHRQENDRTTRGTPGLLAPNWRQQARWGAALFLPAGPDKANDMLPFSVPGTRVLDPISATLVVVGTLYAGFRLFRPYRIFFLGWFLATLAGGALLLSNWAPWKFMGLVPVGFVLAAFLLQDLHSLWCKLVPHRRAQSLFNVALLGAAVYVCSWNSVTLFKNVADNQNVLNEYGHTAGQMYAACDYMQGKGPDTFSYASLVLNADLGFGKPHQTVEEQVGSWGDFVWICHNLEGAALAGPQESWPIRDVHSDPISLAFIVDAEALKPLEDSVQEGYPGAVMDELLEGPSKNYYIVGYSFSSDLVKSQQGLYGEYTPAGASEPSAGQVDDVSNLSWTDSQPPVTPPFTVRWTGLVYLAKGGQYLLEADSADPVRVRLDGGEAYDANDVARRLPNTMTLAAGWHVVEITSVKQASGGGVALRWRAPDGSVTLLEKQDLFALQSPTGWVHTRDFALSDNGLLSLQRIDESVDLANGSVVLQQAQAPYNSLGSLKVLSLKDERYSSWWSLQDSHSFNLQLKYTGGTATIYVDGAQLQRCQAGPDAPMECLTQLSLAPGKHHVEIELIRNGNTLAGARLLVSPLDGGQLGDEVAITPY